MEIPEAMTRAAIPCSDPEEEETALVPPHFVASQSCYCRVVVVVGPLVAVVAAAAASDFPEASDLASASSDRRHWAPSWGRPLARWPRWVPKTAGCFEAWALWVPVRRPRSRGCLRPWVP